MAPAVAHGRTRRGTSSVGRPPYHVAANASATPITVPVTIDTATMYVTGSVVVFRGPVKTISVPQQVFDNGTFAPMRALAERVYVPVFDCLVAKVEVTCS